MSALDLFSSKEIGERLRVARESRNLTQQEAAQKINIARTTLVAIEKGERRVRLSEVQELSNLYGSTMNSLFRSEAIHVDLAPRFRKLSSADDCAIAFAAQLMSNLARAELELENLLGIKRRKDYLSERPILPGDIQIQAEQRAMDLREILGLGFAPIVDIVSLLELELHFRVYIRRIDSKISGLFAYDDALGPCILLNASHSRERRTQSAVHECGHFISARSQPEVLPSDEIDNSREERFAVAFGQAFLAPAEGVMQKFRDITAGGENLTRRHVIVLSHFFGLSREAMVRRLETLKLVKQGAWDWFESNGGITNEQAQQVLGDLRIPEKENLDADRPTTLRLGMLADEVHRKELLSEGQLARLLCLDRVELRKILEEVDSEGKDVDGALKILG